MQWHEFQFIPLGCSKTLTIIPIIIVVVPQESIESLLTVLFDIRYAYAHVMYSFVYHSGLEQPELGGTKIPVMLSCSVVGYACFDK